METLGEVGLVLEEEESESLIRKSRVRATSNGLDANGENGSIDIDGDKAQGDSAEHNGDTLGVSVEVNGDVHGGAGSEPTVYEPIVYLDNTERMWKCRLCIWTHQLEIPAVDHRHNNKGCFLGWKNSKALLDQRLCFSSQVKEGAPVTNEFIETKPGNLESSTNTKLKELADANDTLGGDSWKANGSDSPGTLASAEYRKEGLTEVQNGTLHTYIAGVLGSEEMDLERVLKEQETHDLFCPNCKSCITRRVVLRKRKRYVPLANDIQQQRKKQETDFTEASTESREHEDVQTEAFRCLSCLCIFIRTATGLEFFSRLFHAGNENTRLQSPSQIQQRDHASAENDNSHCFSFLGKWRQDGMTGTVSGEHREPLLRETIPHTKSPTESPFSEAPNVSWSNTSHHPHKAETESNNRKENEEANATNREMSSSTPVKGNSTSNAELATRSQVQKGMSHTTDPNLKDKGFKDTFYNCFPYSFPLFWSAGHAERTGELEKPLLIGKTVNLKSQSQSQLVLESPDVIETSTSHLLEVEEHRLEITPSPGSQLIASGVGIHIQGQKIQPAKPREEPSVSVPGQLKGSVLQTTVGVGTHNLPQGTSYHEWEILKSIVYGGLAESITSLAIISSAAGGDASTLTIVAMGFANLITGLFIMANDLVELRKTPSKFAETVGHPERFGFHVFITFLSYIVFGLVAPITYGFSFRESDDKDKKLIAMSAASLLCIILLAMAKAKVTSKSYIKTTLQYVAIGVGASGLSYVTGKYVRKLLEKLGWITDSNSPSSLYGIVGKGSSFSRMLGRKASRDAYLYY
ncbi:membrane protein of ER body-like protein isoform X6 [Amborella trichopoda]|uniref:membrane protein of ER body-like protein isoform X6 n=1 Tax=Amborella trichopoda TaxID=13333 RepID=UPI0009BE1B8B|nr:membrane protein of ER body-like protein isoform X6 [Amborella trichopoda]|eukprot:XP_020525883.1 membrane protein of ER body-like protein isoform X6 [Amborella trichopoda]